MSLEEKRGWSEAQSHPGEKVCADGRTGRGDVARSPGWPGVPQGLDQARGTLRWSLWRELSPAHTLITGFWLQNWRGGGDEFVLKLSSLWPVAAATPGHWEWTCWLQGENSGRTHPLPPNPNTQSCHEVKWVHTHRWLNQGLTFGSQPASLPPPRHHHRHCEGPSSTHSVDIQGPDAGSEASELGGSTQGSPCLLGPHGEGLCSDTETPGEAGSSGRGRHGRLSIRGGGLIRVHPGGVQPFTQSGGRTPCGTQCPVASPCHGRLWAEPWMTRSLHLTRGRGWHWGNPQWGFFF